MSVNAGSKLIQVISYAINQSSAMPLVARMQVYDALQNYITTQENRISGLEKKMVLIQNNLEIIDNQNIQKEKAKIKEHLKEILNHSRGE